MTLITFILLFLGALCIAVESVYPAGALHCYSSLTAPDGKLICPQGRDVFCVKEVSSLKQDLCGLTPYFGDQYIGQECVFKKCSDLCVDGEYTFDYGGATYTRKRTCCNNDNYCNSANKGARSSYFLLSLLLLITYILAVMT
jgi:hypothetical protein